MTVTQALRALAGTILAAGIVAPSPPRVVEGRPEGGFPYRLYLPEGASAQRPARLVLWLHPTGGLMTKEMEGMAPLFTARGFALHVVTEKSIRGWSGEEAVKLLRPTLADLSKEAAVDASKPILFGFSGGGQLAMTLWHSAAGRFGAVIVDAAYPLDQVGKSQTLMEVPADPGARGVPMFVIVGRKDPVAKAWDQVEAKWREAGIPLEIHRIEGREHEWLFDTRERAAALGAWLEKVGAGQAVAPPHEEPAPAAQP
jgi:predicted esterase